MSIYDEILGHVDGDRLFRLLPPLPRVGVPIRQMFVSTSIQSLIVGPWTDQAWEDRCNELRADLDMFTDGHSVITVAQKPFERKTSYLKRLYPERDEVWEIRSVDPSPQLRVFGRFAQNDLFIALTWELRSDLKDNTSWEGRQAWNDSRTQCA